MQWICSHLQLSERAGVLKLPALVNCEDSSLSPQDLLLPSPASMRPQASHDHSESLLPIPTSQSPEWCAELSSLHVVPLEILQPSCEYCVTWLKSAALCSSMISYSANTRGEEGDIYHSSSHLAKHNYSHYP